MVAQLTSNTLPLTTDEIRMFLQDTAEDNILHDDIIFPEDEIQLAIKLTTSKYNGTTPITNYTATQIPEFIMLYGVCGFLLKSEGIRQMNNQMNTQDGNIASAGLDEKESIYYRWATHFQNEFKQAVKEYKIQKNMESLLDSCNGFGSGYRYIGRY